ncbi:unnamed protein product [Rotaria magnacalcarata]|uniref:Uncharacterized protein n=1 Tax=Rotaria magnacalcarata TaxID=392030 RepID=A0A815DL33_9BILA|nr:unnamed protein product [Rotaria magnacalcarata]CAF3828053.1 unnamed protein product [Rotaria magnacalcarata]CAF3961691.1 unnamed protein product [Rotaria magnacalcarata]
MISKYCVIVSVLLIVIYLKNIVVRTSSLTGKGKFDFGPNQLASSVWYKSKGQLINGHYENSYSNFNLWSNLELHLRNNNGSILIQASDIGFMKNEALMTFPNKINWNVIESWEWRDEHCLDLLYEKFNNATDFDYAYRYVTNPCHQDI